MGKDRLTEPQDRLEQFLQHLEEARQLQRDWMTYGLDCVDIYFEDIDGDWLEKWGEDEQTQQTPTESLIAFLQSDDWVAVRVRKQLIDKPISEIAAKLEKYMSFPQAEDRIFAVKNLLTARLISGGSYQDDNDQRNQEMEIQDLATELLQKLGEMLNCQN
ncbi:MAG: hypothetical protein ACSI46_22035 [Gloeotrichia echinulata DVL01]|nr:hypothetical protein [Gloeotrichia echinulata DEX184]